jgi:hypothetical protein
MASRSATTAQVNAATEVTSATAQKIRAGASQRPRASPGSGLWLGWTSAIRPTGGAVAKLDASFRTDELGELGKAACRQL